MLGQMKKRNISNFIFAFCCFLFVILPSATFNFTVNCCLQSRLKAPLCHQTLDQKIQHELLPNWWRGRLVTSWRYLSKTNRKQVTTCSKQCALIKLHFTNVSKFLLHLILLFPGVTYTFSSLYDPRMLWIYKTFYPGTVVKNFVNKIKKRFFYAHLHWSRYM